jgi:hypothetical protein
MDWQTTYDSGKMDGACHTQLSNGCAPPSNPLATYCNGEEVNSQLVIPNCAQESYVSGTYDDSKVAPYFDIATKYGFANYFFQTNQGPSMPTHLFLFSGTSSPTGAQPQEGKLNFFQAENPLGGKNNDDTNTGCTAPAQQTVQLIDQNAFEGSTSQYFVFPCFSHPSLPTLLDAASPAITWRYYTNKNAGSTTNGIWNAPAAIQEICRPLDGTNSICTGSDYVKNVIVNNPAQVLLDLGTVSSKECNLKNVSWVIPNFDRSLRSCRA